MNVVRDAYSIRALSMLEKSLLPRRMAQNLDLDRIEVHDRPWTFLTPKNVTVVRGHKIFYPGDPGPAEHITHLAHIVHELVHVWQYLYSGVGMYSLRWVDRRYRYSLYDGDHFSSFGLEQQAAIVEDGFLMRHGFQPRWARNALKLGQINNTIDTCKF